MLASAAERAKQPIHLMNVRAAELVAGGTSRMPLAGDQLYVDLDLSAGIWVQGVCGGVSGQGPDSEGPPWSWNDATVEGSAFPLAPCGAGRTQMGRSARQ
jgi:hypothetical protein